MHSDDPSYAELKLASIDRPSREAIEHMREGVELNRRPSPFLSNRRTAIEVFTEFAGLLAHRSTCRRNQVGAVVTDSLGLQILGIGYNGNARGLPNECDSTEPGKCGCLHAEINALLKAPGTLPNKVLYTSVSPCVECAKATINSFVRQVVFRDLYRETKGLKLLLAAKIEVVWIKPNESPEQLYHPARIDQAVFEHR